MDLSCMPENPYLLLTPGPLSTSKSVKATMFRDWCTWDEDYKQIVEELRGRLAALAVSAGGPLSTDDVAVTPMQGSGTFSVEAAITTMVPDEGKLLVLANGAYGQRMGQIALRQRIDHAVLDFGETNPADPVAVAYYLDKNPDVSHVALVHCETTTGMLNPVAAVGEVVKEWGKVFFVDAMSSFGGVDCTLDGLHADFLVSSANKCIQGVPGFGFVIARREELERCEGRARSLSLDVYDQWRVMEENRGKWRFTSPTHVVRAFVQALHELEAEGGVVARAERYRENHLTLVAGLEALGFTCLLKPEHRSPIITSFHSPMHPEYRFARFYETLKEAGFVIYPGKVTGAETFRIGCIGEVYPADMERLVAAVGRAMYWKETAAGTMA